MADVWFSSDLHMYHANIVKFCKETRGGFECAEDMTNALVESFNSVVKPEDTLYVLGDVSFGGLEKVKNSARRLNGYKILTLGNHDHHFKRRPEVAEQFNEVYTYLEKKVCGQFICMMHYPIADWAWCADGSWMLHGHVHGNPTGLEGKIMDVGIDTRTDLRPWHFDEIKEIMEGRDLKRHIE